MAMLKIVCLMNFVLILTQISSLLTGLDITSPQLLSGLGRVRLESQLFLLSSLAHRIVAILICLEI